MFGNAFENKIIRIKKIHKQNQKNVNHTDRPQLIGKKNRLKILKCKRDILKELFYRIKISEWVFLVQEPTAQKPMLSSTRKKPLFYGRVEVGESNHLCLPEVKWCRIQKLLPPVVEASVYHCVCPTNKGMKASRIVVRQTQ